ncbi:Hsp20/alpha crystallin family protein [Actinacidiphila oryziradicis]|jgi:HSP20 family protein|uniref:Hsp20/alpha crystallin family protein n=2 Tax=Actinacidiphila oryziradicis TaxID=2571141 RepID=A0A4U0ST69_9ACTN|nr:Hsp20/alpha crystallin family protein [Actinacidiphila oryziradicis]
MTLPASRPRQPSGMARRSDPVQQIENVYSQMDQLLQGFFGQQVPESLAGTRWAAPADIEETDDAFIVQLDVPGVKPEDIDVELRENQVRITGEIKEKERTGVLRRQTRPVGRFEHLIALPGEVDPDKVEATLSDGVLTLRLTKTGGPQTRHIQVKGG